jgi:hypothetical protein
MVDQRLAEGLAGARPLARLLAPLRPSGVELRGRGLGAGIGVVEALGDPVAQRVLRVEIFLGCLGDDLRRVEALLLPLEAVVDRPVENPRPLLLELRAEIGSAGMVTVKGTR